ncbi:MAG: FAD-dependent thymidylate synthase, partial [Deltaproteobacteria bacterium]|nr:FAD-dependent thymidylate synthase [Deltaproteobacteria bacterium]
STDETVSPETAEKICKEFREEQQQIYKQYESYLAAGMAREVARANLPLSLYTEWYWKIDLHNLLHFLSLRLDAHAQKEIRVFAEAMGHFVKQQCPIAWEAFEEYVFHAAHISKSERQLLSGFIQQNNLWEEIVQKRTAQLKEEGASEQRIERELESLKQRLAST